ISTSASVFGCSDDREVAVGSTCTTVWCQFNSRHWLWYRKPAASFSVPVSALSRLGNRFKSIHVQSGSATNCPSRRAEENNDHKWGLSPIITQDSTCYCNQRAGDHCVRCCQ